MFIALCNLDMNNRFILPHNILHMTRNIPNQNQYRLVTSEMSFRSRDFKSREALRVCKAAHSSTRCMLSSVQWPHSMQAPSALATPMPLPRSNGRPWHPQQIDFPHACGHVVVQ